MLDAWKGFLEPGSEAEALAAKLDPGRLPAHVAVIMDGNGRWAKEKGRPRVDGHRAAIKSVKEIVETAARTGIRVLSLYAFSQENWKRPRREVATLFRVLEQYLIKEDKILIDNDLRLKVLGRREGLPASLVRQLDRVEAVTASNRRMTVGLALNYGARTEIVDAVRDILRDGRLKPEDVDEAEFARHLYTAGLPDPDLLIRTSGELRISNFLLWQIAYAEIWVTPVFWPDFRKVHFFQALLDYQSRNRRFGDVRSAR
ncbi:MAG: isoprenyl transferase [Candidatus Aminicenantes bacterium]|nr:isoprenyl transferase [Candidatus Aminicenantes bacterium]